jgi:hypothetical protein
MNLLNNQVDWIRFRYEVDFSGWDRFFTLIMLIYICNRWYCVMHIEPKYTKTRINLGLYSFETNPIEIILE